MAIAAGSDTAPALLHLAVAALGFTALHGFLRTRAGQPAAWFGVAVLASVTSLTTLATRAYVDWGVITFGFLAYWALEEAIWQRDRRWLVLSAVLAGMTMGSKYTGLFPVAGVGLVLGWQVLRGTGVQGVRPVTTRWRDLALWGGVATAVVSPWLVRNLLLTGNPVYPFLFGGWQWDAWKTAWITRPGTGLMTEPLRVLLAPWEVTVLGQEGRLYDASLGPLLLALLPLGLLCLLPARNQGRWPARALAVAAVAYGCWLAGAAQSSLLMQGRLLLPVAPLLAAAAAAGWVRLIATDAAPVRAGWLSGVVVAMVAVVSFGTLALTWAGNPPLPVLAGAESRETYHTRTLGAYAEATGWVNLDLPPDARILQLWEPRTYLCQRACHADALLFNWRYLLHTHGDASAVAAALRQAGYSHVLINGGGLRFFTEPPEVEAEPAHVQALHQMLGSHAALVQGTPIAETLAQPLSAVAGRGYALYALTPGSR
ncbi:MAG: ArnT family glycosyltransferase [Aquabacterium sp.]